ncbi:MAG: dimethylmenaquinone methyltransferase, partial [Rhodothermia bacterium]|nr:dimethylmenaquinone methyltransferase [Rhodothermia bacterium]
LCGLGLMYVPDPISCLREMHRVLGNGKRAVTAVWGRRERCGWAEVFPIVDRRVASEVCPMFFQFGTGDASLFAFKQAGFEDIELERLSVTLHYESADEACAAVFAGGPVALAYRKFDDDTRRAAHAEYLASIEPHRVGRGYEIPGEYVITRAATPA